MDRRLSGYHHLLAGEHHPGDSIIAGRHQGKDAGVPQGAPVFLQMKMKKIPISALAALPFVLLVALYELTPLF